MKKLLTLLILTALCKMTVAQTIQIVSDETFIKICPGYKTEFTVSATGDTDPTSITKYKWDFGNGITRYSNNPKIEYTYNVGGSYILTVTAQSNDLEIPEAKIEVRVGKKPDFKGFKHDIPSNQEGVCLGENVKLTMPIADEIINNSYTQSYDLRRAVWQGKGVSATSAGIALATPPEEGATRYTFSISDDFGCIHDTSVFVSVERALAQGADSTIFIGDEIPFENKTTWAVETSWSFGDKSTTENISPAPHAYYERGKYYVVMQSTSSSGCIDMDTLVVNIVPRPLEIKEVNIFTPNGDGINDVFTFFNEDESFLSNGGLTQMPANIRTLKCKIYNSYGQTICKWENVEPSIFGWDGTIDNKGDRQCPPGTYFYDLIVYGKDGNSVKRTGTIYLYRSK